MAETGVQHFLRNAPNNGDTDNPEKSSACPVLPDNQQPVFEFESHQKSCESVATHGEHLRSSLFSFPIH